MAGRLPIGTPSRTADSAGVVRTRRFRPAWKRSVARTSRSKLPCSYVEPTDADIPPLLTAASLTVSRALILMALAGARAPRSMAPVQSGRACPRRGSPGETIGSTVILTHIPGHPLAEVSGWSGVRFESKTASSTRFDSGAALCCSGHLDWRSAAWIGLACPCRSRRSRPGRRTSCRAGFGAPIWARLRIPRMATS
jgi:hypothetical protein